MRASIAALCIAAGAAAYGGGVGFQRLQFGGEASRGLFAADLDGDGSRDLIGLGRGRISIYRGQRARRPQYPSQPETLLTHASAYFADIADVHPAPGAEVVILTPTGVSCFVHEGGRYARRPIELLRCDTLLTARPVRGAVELAKGFRNTDVLPWNFAFDLNGDGRDDILVPHGGGTDVYLQRPGGDFGRPATLPVFPLAWHGVRSEVKSDHLVGHETPNVSIELILRRIVRRDVNRDGRPDLVCGRYWFAQKPTGDFDTVASEAPPEATTLSTRGRRADINADGHTDLIAEHNSFDDPLNIITRVRVYLADRNGAIPAIPTQTVVGQNVLVHTPLPVHDFNNDGAMDFAMFKTDITLTEVAKWVRQSLGKIDGMLRIWYFDRAANRYSRRPSYEKAVRMRFKVDLMEAMQGLVWERYLGTMMRFEGDYNADGRLDLLVRSETNKIDIYFNRGDPRRLFGSRPDITLGHSRDDLVPMFGGLSIEDLNGDGAGDLILFAAATDRAGHFISLGDVVCAYISHLR